MPTNLDYKLYFDLALYGGLGFGFLFGVLKGFKKSIYSFLTYLILIVGFFVSITPASEFLWSYENPQIGALLGQYLGSMIPTIGEAGSVGEAITIAIGHFAGETYAGLLANAHLLELVEGIGTFVIKIVYTLLYFTIFWLIYKLLCAIIYAIFFKRGGKDDKYRSKNRLLGGVFGVLEAAVAVYVMLISLSGMLDIVKSMTALLPVEDETIEFEFPRSDIYEASQSMLAIVPDITIPPQVQESLDMMNEIIAAWDGNLLVQMSNQLTYNDEGTAVPLSLHLFDMVLSIDYDVTATETEQISFRHELSVFAGIAGYAMSLEFVETGEISSITRDNVVDVFEMLGESKLLTTLIPLGIEVAAEIADLTLDLPTEDLYALDWASELDQLGVIAAVGFDIVNQAGLLAAGTPDYTTITVDGDLVRDLFDALADSDLVNLAILVAIEPVMELAGDQINAVITVPEDIVWADEFRAMGAFLGAVLDTGLTMAALQADDEGNMDYGAILTAVASVDFTLLLDSRLFTTAIINVLSGAVDIPGLSGLIVIPDGLVWYDEYDDDGNLIAAGELRNILLALNAVVQVAAGVDFNNLGLGDVALLTDDTIDAIFNSQVLVASLSAQLADLDTGEFQLIIPDAVRDVNGNIVKAEFVAVTRALRLASERLACDEGDLVCQESFIDIGKIFTITGDDLDTLLASQILTATIGNYVNTMEIEALVVPGSALTDVLVDGAPVEVIAASEIRSVFAAVLLLNIDSFENFEFTADLLANLEGDVVGELSDEKLDTLFASLILRATIAKVLIDMTAADDPIVVIPTLDVDGNPVLIDDPVDGTDMLAATELSAILKGVYALDLDFTNPDFTNIGPILEHVDLLLESAILHATISDLLITLEGGMIIVPELYGDPETEIQKTVGGTHYIVKDELNKIFDALELLEITTFDSIAFDASIIDKFSDAEDPTILDEAKLDTMLASVILRATVSNMIVDLIDVEPGQEALVVIPDQDVDGLDVRFTDHGFDYISTDELKAILRSFKALGFTDFENMSFTDLDPILSNIDILLDSAVLHATISDVLLDLATPPVGEEATIVIPVVHGDGLAAVEIQITVGATTYIAKSELTNIIDALSILGITNTDNIAFDATIIENLEDAENPGSLDDAKLDTLFSSYILRATISKMLLDLMEVAPGEEPLVIVPETDWDGNPVEYVDHAVTYISQDELENVLKALFSLGITDFNNVSSLSIQNVIDHFDELILSAILHATISKQILDIEADMIVIPHDYTRDYGLVTEADVEIIRSIGVTDPIEMVSADELNAMLDAVELLGFTDFSVSLDAGIISTLQVEGDPTQLDPAKLDILFGSAIIHASISNMFSDLTQADPGEEPLVIVPETDWDGVAVLYDDPLTALEYVSTAELEAVLAALNSLNITDFNNVSSLSLANIMDHFDELIQSAILHATVSKQVLDIEADMIVIPHDYTRDYGLITEADVEIIRTIGVDNPVDMISEAELTAMLDAIELLGFTDFSVSLDAGIISTLQVEGDPTQLDPAKLDVLFGSAIIHASISNMFSDLTHADPGEEPLVIVPETDWDGVAVLYDDPLTALEYVSTAELEAVLSALNSLNITDFNNVSALELSNIMAHFDELIQSAILHATVSKQVLDIEADMIVIPGSYTRDYGLITETDVEIIRTIGVDNPVDLISEEELTAMLDAIEMLGFTDFSVSFDAGIITTLQLEGDPTQLDQAKLDVLFGSAIIHASISNMFSDLTQADPGEEPLVIVPETDWDGVAVLYDDPLTALEYVSTAELEAVLSALNSLGITDFNNVSSLELSNIMAHFDELIASAILHATISKQVLDIEADMIVVPGDYTKDYGLVTEADVQIIRSVGVDNPVDLISETELNAMFDAIELLGFTDFSVSLDAGIISTLQVEGDPTQLDQAKLDVLFASAIIHASISNMFADLTAADPGEEPLVIVPETDWDGVAVLYDDPLSAIEYVSTAELSSVLSALNSLGITDFNNVSTLDLANVMAHFDDLIGSAILHATISKQILDIDAAMIVIPDDYTVNYGLPGETQIEITRSIGLTDPVTMISADELDAMFASLDLLGFTDFSVSLDATIIDALEDEVDPTTLDQSKLNILFASAIIHASFSQMFFDLTDVDPGEEALVVVPEEDVDGIAVLYTDFAVEFVSIAELDHTLYALHALNVTDFGAVDALDMDTIIAEMDVLLNSAIMHATISKQILGITALVIPYRDAADTTDIRITVLTTEFIDKDELGNLFDGLQQLGVSGDLSQFSGDVDYTAFFDDAKRTVILSSAIMHAMISDTLVNFDPDMLTVPYYAETGSTPADLVRLTVGAVGFENEYVKLNEIHAMFVALRTLGIDGNIENFDGTVDLDALFDETKRDDVLNSSILQARISEELFNLGAAVIDVPYVEADGTTAVRRTVGALETETEYVLKSELIAIFVGLAELGFTGDIQGFTGAVNMTSLFAEASRTAILDSATLHARISKELIDLTAATLAIPYVGADGVTAIRVTVGAVGFETEYVEASELARMFEALQLLGFAGDIQGFDGTIDASALFSDDDPTYQRSTVLSSAIIHAKISEELIGLGATLEIPFTAADGATDIRETVGDPGETTEYVVETELANLFEAMELLGFTGDILGAGFTGEFDLTALFDDVDRAVVLDSSIIHAKISTELVGLGVATLAIPYTAADDVSAVRETVGAFGFTTEYVVESELSALFEAMELLGFTGDILGAGFTGTFDLTPLFDGAKRPTVLASSIIHAKISSELVDLGAATLSIPYTAADGVTDIRLTVGAVGLTTEYITAVELGAMFEAMELLGFSGDVLGAGFTGDFDLTALFDDDAPTFKRSTVLASSIIHAKISAELADLGAATLAIPYTAADGVTDVRLTVGAIGFETEYIAAVELGAMFDAMELLGFTGDVLGAGFTGVFDLTALFDDVDRATVLDSSIIHAKISTELVNLGAATLAIPYTAANGIADVRTTVGAFGFTTEYIVEGELSTLFEAMELLGFTGDILGVGFDGSFNLTALFDETKRPTVLDSSIIHAKISAELIGLGAATLDIPYGTEDYDTLIQATHVRQTVGDPGLTTEYIAEVELGYLFEGLETLGFSGDVLTEFNGDINISAFYNPVQRASVLQSAILQAKISLEMFNLGSSTMLIPTTDVNDVVVRLDAGPFGFETDYITKDEIGHLFDALGVLGLSGDANFSGTVNLNNVADGADQDTLFTSATMHATISQTVLGLDDDGILIVPSYTQDGAIAANAVRLAVTGTDFVTKGELKHLIDALIAMGYGDLSIAAAIDTSKFFTETATILASATMQATISAEVLKWDDGGLDDALVIPSYTIDGVADLNKIRKTVSGIAFVDRDELEALFTALGAMGFDDLDSFGGGISSNLFFAQKATILLSSIMHATISDQLLNDTAGALLVPDTDVENGDADIRITVSGTEFITAQEISDLLDALDEMGLTNFGALDISIANIFAADFNILLASASMQATISDSLLEAPTKDETTMVSGSSDLVVPTVFRQDITVGAVSYEQIEEAELLELLDGLDQLGFTSFGSSMSGTATSTFDYAKLMDIMESGSLHVTLHTMLQGSVAADTPDLAKEVALYGVAGLTKATEIAYFIVAVNTIGESDFTDADFSITAILSLTVEQRGTVFDSMIVRNMLTDDIETAIALINANNLPFGPFYTFDNADYMESNPALFLTKAGALDAVAFIDSETP